MKLLSIKQIDRACRDNENFFVYVGNRQKVFGAVKNSGLNGEAASGHCWIDPGGAKDWQQVKLTEITVEKKNGGTMGLKGKGQSGRPTHVKLSKGKAKESKKSSDSKPTASKKSASKGDDLVSEDRFGQGRIPGTERRTNAKVEKQALLVYDLQSDRMAAAKKEQVARKELTRLMKELDIPEQDLPDDLIAELDLEPKAKVHKKKQSKKNDPTAPEGGDAAVEE